MVRYVEKQDLRGADQERAFHARRVGRQAALETLGDQVAKRAKPPQHRRNDAADERAVTLGEQR